MPRAGSDEVQHAWQKSQGRMTAPGPRGVILILCATVLAKLPRMASRIPPISLKVKNDASQRLAHKPWRLRAQAVQSKQGAAASEVGAEEVSKAKGISILGLRHPHPHPDPDPHPPPLSQLSEPSSQLPVPSSHLSPRSSQLSILRFQFSVFSSHLSAPVVGCCGDGDIIMASHGDIHLFITT